MISEVYDIEVLSNLFTYTGYVIPEKKFYQFVIHKSRNDLEILVNHLTRGNILQIGFNNEKYDYPVIHHILNHYSEYRHLSGFDVARKIYEKSQAVIEMEFSAIADRNKFIKQLDLFLIHHFNNKARSASLKSLEIAMQFENVEDMPFSHHYFVTKQEEIDMILSYNQNDVAATLELLKYTLGKTDHIVYKGRNKIGLRLDFQKKFNFPCLNYPDTTIGERLFLKLYSERTGIDAWTLKDQRTFRREIHLKDCLPAWYQLGEIPEFADLEQVILNTVVDPNVDGEKTKEKQFTYDLIYHGIKISLGLGGLHGCIKPGVYDSDDEWCIYDVDVGSLHPSTAKILGLFPEHLGRVFVDIYSEFIDTRLAEKNKPKAERDNVLVEGYKLSLNGVYGKSKSPHSFLYDPFYTYRVTIGGQMLLLYWAHLIVQVAPTLTFIQFNTDGITMKLRRSDLNKVKAVNERITKQIGYLIEDAMYDRMVIRDVSNYAARYEGTNDIKFKGCFEYDKELHKDPSMRVVPLALKAYYFDNIPVREFIANHKNIYDFCLMKKVTSSSSSEIRYQTLEEDIKLPKTVRYYISNTNACIYMLYNRNGKKHRVGVNVGFNTQLFNKYKEQDDYNINYNFYVAEANKIINTTDDRQMSLYDIMF